MIQRPVHPHEAPQQPQETSMCPILSNQSHQQQMAVQAQQHELRILVNLPLTMGSNDQRQYPLHSKDDCYVLKKATDSAGRMRSQVKLLIGFTNFRVYQNVINYLSLKNNLHSF